MKTIDLTNQELEEISDQLPGDFHLDRNENNELVLVDDDVFHVVHSFSDIFKIIYKSGFSSGQRSIQQAVRRSLGL
jgi:hypothetical protein